MEKFSRQNMTVYYKIFVVHFFSNNIMHLWKGRGDATPKKCPGRGLKKKKKIGVCVAKRVAYIYGWMEWVRLWLGDPTLSNALSRTILS